MNILVVDDTQLSREGIARYLNKLGHRAEAHGNPFTALEALENGPWDLVLTDLRMPSMDGLQFLNEIKGRRPDTAVIIMTAYATVETAVKALREGALDYVIKPFPMEQLHSHVERLAELLKARQELAVLRKTVGTDATHSGLVGNSPQMQKVFHLIDQFADKPANVLITGATGTGKEMVARALHLRSRRKNGPFIPVPCAALPRELAESELFGHEAGAFTGASKQHHGRVELANGGTLYLDDVDDLPLDTQPKLLRAIQEREFQRVGGERLLKADLRILSSTKKDLEVLVNEGRFRQDLLYRLRVLTISLPPLRERKGDIILLAQHFLAMLARETDEQARVLSAGAQQKLLSHTWPGNVRELRHAIDYAVAVSGGPTIQADDLQLRTSAAPTPEKLFVLNLGEREELDWRALQPEIEKEVLFWALKKAQGDQGRAAEILKMPRSTFQYRLRQLGSGQPEEALSSTEAARLPVLSQELTSQSSRT